MVNRRDNARGYSRDAYGSSDRRSRSAYSRDAYGSGAEEGSPRRARTRADRVSHASHGAEGEGRAARSRTTDHAARPQRRSAAAERGMRGASDNPYSRDSVNRDDYAKRRKKGKKRLFVALAVVAVLVLGGAGAAWAYMSGISGKLSEGVDDNLLNALADTEYKGEPFYALLMGSDGSAERAADEYYGDVFRADTTILARIDPKAKTVALVSIPRDTLCDMGEYGQNKLNAAHALGGAALAVETVSELAGVEISHYAEINFDGFKAIVDSLGGIEVDVPMEIDDPDAGGYVAAGPQTLNGDQALILCRARHAYDAYGPGDLYRAANQRLVLSAIAHKLLGSDPVTIAGTVQSLAGYVTTDMDVMEIVGVANSMRGIDTATSMFSATAPTVSEYIDGGWYEILQVADWEDMMKRVDEGLPPTEEDVVDQVSGTILANAGSAADAKADFDSKRIGNVSVMNGTDIAGAAAAAAEKVSALGYDTTAGNANGAFDETVIVYETADQQEYAQEIADALGIGKVVQNNNEYIFTGDFLVVVGEDWPQ